MSESHKHAFTETILIPLVADKPGKRKEQYDYAGIGAELPHFGRVEAMAILARKCTCGALEAFDMGKRSEMKAKLQQLQPNKPETD